MVIDLEVDDQQVETEESLEAVRAQEIFFCFPMKFLDGDEVLRVCVFKGIFFVRGFTQRCFFILHPENLGEEKNPFWLTTN